ncbi:MAG: flagellar basal body-associated FliL family protein [Calditrichaeota bacterium]|nr:flagellar basal body-associated FliL family protein [Calditrichota bacterium]
MKKHASKIIILAGIILFQVALAFILIKILLPQTTSGENDSKKEAKQVVKKQTSKSKDGSLEKSELSTAILKNSAMINIEDLVVNPNGSKGKRYLIISLYIYLTDKSLQEKLDVEKPAIKDGLISLLSQKPSEILSDVSNQASLRKEIKLTIENILQHKVFKVYLTKYVMQ